MVARLTRPGNTVVGWPNGEPMVMASGVGVVARRFLGLADLRMELMGYWVGVARVKLGVKAGLEEEEMSMAGVTLEPKVMVEEVPAESSGSVVLEEEAPAESRKSGMCEEEVLAEHKEWVLVEEEPRESTTSSAGTWGSQDKSLRL